MIRKLLRVLVIGVLLAAVVGCSFEEQTQALLAKHEHTTEATPEVKLKDLPDALKMAIVDVEDSRFYEHHGVDLLGIGRALYRDVSTLSPAEGGSTLTQQLARNVYLNQDRTISRKVREIALAVQLERTYSKDEILELYLNNVYFGNGAYGIRAAADSYFGKGQNLKTLTLAECALLAGLPNAPTALNPFVESNVQDAIDRRSHVLEAMYENGDITKEEMQKARNEPLLLK
jgi:membrane peptidoglycan carboxypeptidase